MHMVGRAQHGPSLPGGEWELSLVKKKQKKIPPTKKRVGENDSVPESAILAQAPGFSHPQQRITWNWNRIPGGRKDNWWFCPVLGGGLQK